MLLHQCGICFTCRVIISPAVEPRVFKNRLKGQHLSSLQPKSARERQLPQTDADFFICLPGTFSSSEGLGPCLPCAKCPRSVPTVASCSATQDTQCECDDGYFFLGRHALCLPCSKCTPGEGVTRECGPHGDTRCEVCGPGTFSEERFSTKPCQACTQCSDSEVEIRHCMPNADALCMGEL